MYKEVISPILDRMDSETWHVRAREALHFAETFSITLKVLERFAYKKKRFSDARLNMVVGGVRFENPLVLGAGWDKVGRSVQAWWQLGFAGAEIGSVLARLQWGNSGKRQFMLAPGVALNRLGFNSPGMRVVDRELWRYMGSGIPIGVSIGKNADVPDLEAPEAHAVVAARLCKHASYFTVNVSSPNTPGLRRLQDKGPLTDTAQAVSDTVHSSGHDTSVFVKLAPDLTFSALDDAVAVVIDNGLAGLVLSNTTNNSDVKAKYGRRKYGKRWRDEPGGLSGDDEDFRRMSTEQIAHIYRETNGQVDIFGVGGVKDVSTALEKIRAGARGLQIVTAIRSEGTTLPGRINRGLVEYMEREGIGSISEIVGVDAK